MKKFNLITSIISLVLSLCLVINLAFAWFSNNKSASSNSTVSVIDKEEIVSEVLYYTVSSNEDNTITLKENLGSGSSNYEMAKYSILNDNIDTIIMAVKLNSNTSLDLSLKTSLTADDYTKLIGYDSEDETTGIKSTNNSLSSVLKFSVLSVSGLGTNTLTYTSMVYSSFIDTTNNSVSNKEYSNISSYNNYVFIAFDYDKDLIEYLYNKNLGNDNLSNSDGYLTYICDFYVEIKGGE